MPLQIVILARERSVGPNRLLVEGLDHRRQESVQTERRALGIGESRAAVQSRRVKESHPRRVALESGRRLWHMVVGDGGGWRE